MKRDNNLNSSSSASYLQTLREINKADAKDKLRYYIEDAWHVLEPRKVFVSNWSIDAVCDHLEAVSRQQITRLLINVPPGTMKSLTTEVFWPSWEWGPQDRSDLRYVSFSYSADLTIRDNRKCRNLITSKWYKDRWGDRFNLVSDQDTKTKFETNRSGWKLATSVEGLGTGERGDRVIVDDPHQVKAAESDTKRRSTLLWFTETLPTRLNDPMTTPIVIIMQRVHNSDVSGHILAQELGYEHLMLPMEYEDERKCFSIVRPSYIEDPKEEPVSFDKDKKLWIEDSKGESKRYCVDPRTEDNELLWPDRMDRVSTERDKKVMGEYAVAGQFQQRPVPRGGGMFKHEWFDIIENIPDEVNIIRSARGWDLAASKEKSSPYTCGVKLSLSDDGIIYIEHVKREKGSSGQVETWIKGYARTDGKECIIGIPQDPGQAGKAQKSYYAKKLRGWIVRFSPESGSKEVRADPFASQCEALNVKMVKGAWNYDYLGEMCLFPYVDFKDQVDATSRAFHELNTYTEVGVVGPETVETEL